MMVALPACLSPHLIFDTGSRCPDGRGVESFCLITEREQNNRESKVKRVKVVTIDPGDMRTQMHLEAFPGQDIRDRLILR